MRNRLNPYSRVTRSGYRGSPRWRRSACEQNTGLNLVARAYTEIKKKSPLELCGIERGRKVRESRAASVVHVEVRELDHSELAAQVFTLVELDFDEEHVGLLRGESSESRVEPVTQKTRCHTNCPYDD